MKKNILWFILGGIIFSSITATAAYVYTARDIGYAPQDENWNVENVQEALTELKTDVNTITNKVEGIERVYKAGEVNLVANTSDDSFYKDSNGKYVLANSTTGGSLLSDTENYKSLVSTEDTMGEVGVDTASPFSSGYKESGMSLATYNNSYNLTLQIYNFKNSQLSQDTTTKRLQGEYIELSSNNFYISIKALKKAHYVVYRIKNTDTSTMQPLIDGVYDANQNIFTDSGQNYDYTYRYLVFAK